MYKDKNKTEVARGSRGSRGSRLLVQTRSRTEVNTTTSQKEDQPKKDASKEEKVESDKEEKKPIRGPRISRRGNHQSQRINRRLRQPNRNSNRLDRAQNAARSQQRGKVGRFRAPGKYFNFRRRPIRRSIFVAGLPTNVNQFRLSGLLKKEGNLLRCTLLRDKFGNSRGIAFAEMQNPRDARKIIEKWNGRNVEGNKLFVTFKRNPRRPNYYPRYNYRYPVNRRFNFNFNNYNPRYQKQNRARGNLRRGRGFGRGRGRGY